MVKEVPKKPRRVSDEEVRETIIGMCRAAGLEGSVRPEDIAQRILPDHWQTLLKRIRLMARQMAASGRLTILRKGEPADPFDFKGLIRLRVTEKGLVDEAETDEEA